MLGERRFAGLVLNRGDKLSRDEAKLGRSRYFGLEDISESKSPEDLRL